MQQIELEKDNHFYLKSNKLDFRQILISIFLMYVIVFPRDMINIKEILLCINIFIGLPAIIYMIKYKSKKNSFLIAYSLVFSGIYYCDFFSCWRKFGKKCNYSSICMDDVIINSN